jgi:hypothetical protein
MWNIILDGLFIFIKYIGEITVFFVCIFGLGYFLIRQLTNKELDPILIFFASFGIGSISLCVISYILILIGSIWPALLRTGSMAVLLLAGFLLLKNFVSNEIKVAFNIQIIAAGAGLLLLLLIRLAYLKNIIFPPYSDSPIHYQIIFSFLNPDTNYQSKLSLENIFTNYYHFGFHGIAAWLASISRLDPINVIPLLGQLFLVIAPISVAALAYAITNNLYSALFSGLLAAVGWLMPAFSANWGKYPALTAIATLPVILALPWLYQYRRDGKSTFLFYALVLVVGIVLIHSRILICLLLVLLCYFLSGKFQFKERLSFFQSIRLSLLFAISLWPLLQFFLEFYKGVPVWIILLILLPFAFQSHPRITTGIFFFMFGLWFVDLVPRALKLSAPLLDRQFLEMMLYIPCSIIGGIGFDGLIRKLEPNRILKWGAVVIFAGGVLFNFQQHNSLSPDSCCNYFTKNDQLAFQWIQNNDLPHTLFIISTFSDGDKMYGTDAGIWITPITKIAANKLLFNAKWNSDDMFSEICRASENDTYIYAGGNKYSFDKTQLSSETWLKSVFQTGTVEIYQVVGCTK